MYQSMINTTTTENGTDLQKNNSIVIAMTTRNRIKKNIVIAGWFDDLVAVHFVTSHMAYRTF